MQGLGVENAVAFFSFWVWEICQFFSQYKGDLRRVYKEVWRIVVFRERDKRNIDLYLIQVLCIVVRLVYCTSSAFLAWNLKKRDNIELYIFWKHYLYNT